MGDNKRGAIRVTREIVVNIHGEEYDCLLIPRKPFVEVDYTKFPEDDPMRRERNIQVITGIDLELEYDLTEPYGGGQTFRLSKGGAKRLLEAL